jgi:hypothetical protein
MQLPAYAQEKVGAPLRFSIGTHADFTDNRDSVDFNKVSNTDIFVSPRVEYIYNADGTRINLHYMPSIRYRTEAGDTGDDTVWQHDLGLKIYHALTERTRLHLREKYDYNDDSAIETGGVLIRGSHAFSENTIEAGFDTDILRYSNFEFMIKNNMKRFDEDIIARRSDEDVTAFNANYRHRINQTLRYVVGATYGMFSYDNSLNRDFNSIIGKVGLENAFTANMQGTLLVGWQNSDFDDDFIDAKDEPYLLASLENQTGEDFTVGGSIGHGIRDTDAFPFTAQVYTEVKGFADLSITPKLALHGSATYRLSEYDEEDLPAGAAGVNFKGANGGDDTTIVGDIVLDYSLLDNLSLYAGYRYEDIDSEVAQSYTKNTGRLGAALLF